MPIARGHHKVKYTVVFHRTEEGISVSVPGLPGCWSEGDSEQEALENIQDALEEYLAAVKEMNQTQNLQH
nr:type II toxin-antitoxin system HicB family antitoxin [Chromatium okenii]